MEEIEIRYSDRNTSPDVINSILSIEKSVYEPKYCGTFESVKSRYDKFNEMFVLAYDNNKLAGYLCYFPISEKLHDDILDTDSLHDDDISPDDIVHLDIPEADANNSGESRKYHFYLISVAVSPEYHKKGIGKLLMDGLFEKLREFEKVGILTDDILASTVSKDGEKTVKKYGFKKKSNYPEATGYQVYQKNGLAMYSDVYVMIPVTGKLYEKYLDTDATVGKYIQLINENFNNEC
ncbi:MAG: GNAT family N-acetyltransferase, partial [Clostridia bacterium]|nr:GNAT family N-acetyltransferase [Clostridia bacterium]